VIVLVGMGAMAGGAHQNLERIQNSSESMGDVFEQGRCRIEAVQHSTFGTPSAIILSRGKHATALMNLGIFTSISTLSCILHISGDFKLVCSDFRETAAPPFSWM